MAREDRNYSEGTIEILEGLSAVRKRPAMYIGSTDYRGLHHCVWEIVDNSIDEAMMGFGKKIILTIHKDGSLSVEDFGRGIPTGRHKSGVPTPQVVYTILHAGGKFSDKVYSASVGLHGVGASVVTALSEYLDVTIYKDGKVFNQRYEKGGSIIGKADLSRTTTRTGTIVRFLPDPKIFSSTEFKFSLIAERLQESAFLLPGVELVLIDERSEKVANYCYQDGLIAYCQFINEDKEVLTPIMSFVDTYNSTKVEIVMQYTTEYDETIISFANNVKTIDGGTHETGFRTAFTRCLNDYAKKYNIIKERDKIDSSDYREGLTAIVSVKVPEKYLQFEGQTKSKLGSPEVRNAVDSVLTERFTYYLEENKEMANKIINRAKKASLAREAARKAREEARSGKKVKAERLLSGKLTPAQSKKSSECELFLVEGDSAGGSAKQGRDRLYQAILPLRGKVINSERSDLADLLKNEEISTMIYTIGAGYGQSFSLNDCNYGKVIIMTDADTDGAHIQVLLLTFFFRYMRALIEAGRVYVALPPLYKVYKYVGKKEKSVYCWDEEDLEAAKEKIGTGYSIQRYKGLGEMNPGQLWETTMNPKTRSLIQVKIDNLVATEKKVTVLMGKDAKLRRNWIEENIKFTLEDDFLREVK